MIPLVASEETFVRDVLIDSGAPPSQFVQYALLAEELLAIVQEDVDPSSTKGQLLTGLLRDQLLVPVPSAALTKNLNPRFTAAKPEYVELALKCSKHFVYKRELPQSDLAEFTRFGITAHNYNNIGYQVILGQYKSNVVRDWSLTEGGNSRLSDHCLEYVHHVGRVQVYDRYFGRDALSSITELFSAYSSAFGAFTGHVKIYVGAGLKDHLAAADVNNALGQHIDISKLLIARSNKVATSSSHAHDRYIQFDEDYTLEFSAGLGCYYASSGHNRSSTVYLKNVVINYASLDIEDEHGVRVQFRY
ncbi:hypothetical protein N7E02_18325 [Aliirhizobium terrae]|uniref:hypothetical protein n=1 Tax=Terrirhizobium terrae TaxID=2926709 RepID=UPI002576344F|nr:hypothetical protein [Rhizobium sp. CC-CFT758]WJH42126.1 hypothetical protein N7E02_18325 [Rhizobium sp. CC-CFT758]